LTPVLHLRYFQLILPILISERILVLCLQMDQANADKNIAQAKAEERRAMAVALEQENKALAQEMRPPGLLKQKLRCPKHCQML
jgi:uncharacterized protein YqfA (UPF0365 family)